MKAKPDLKDVIDVSSRWHTHAHTERLSEVGSIDLDTVPRLLFFPDFAFSRGCHSHSAGHLSLRRRSHSQRGKFGFERHALDFARATQNVLANNHPSVSKCGCLEGR